MNDIASHRNALGLVRPQQRLSIVPVDLDSANGKRKSGSALIR